MVNFRSGFITAVLLVVAALVVLGYFKVNIQTVFSSPDVQANLYFAWQLFVAGVKEGWQYLSSLIQLSGH